MEAAIRYGIGFATGIVVTVILLYIMQAVIQSDKNPLNEAPKIRLVDFVRVLEDEAVELKDLRPKPPPPVDEAPPDIPKQSFDTDTNMGVAISQVSTQINIDIGAGGFSPDGEYLPIVKVEPIYPRRALTRGIEGFVLLSFCVTTTGSVRDPVVVEEEPSSIFTRAATNAALKFKYKPKVVDGQPIEVCGVLNRLKFELEQ
ncbi:MAG: energy transducer TonB [Gammaproteobacteria bacterium]|nr:energy transducer TonB [Gammaproteobacteria bacterium]